jgi:hypothetical protein
VLHEETSAIEGRAPDRLTYRLGKRRDGTFRETWRDDRKIEGEPDPILDWSEDRDGDDEQR